MWVHADGYMRKAQEALVVKAEDQIINCWLTNQWPRMPQVDVPTFLWCGLTARKPMIQCHTCEYWTAWGYRRSTPGYWLFLGNVALEDYLSTNSKSIAGVTIKCCIYQIDALSPKKLNLSDLTATKESDVKHVLIYQSLLETKTVSAQNYKKSFYRVFLTMHYVIILALLFNIQNER